MALTTFNGVNAAKKKSEPEAASPLEADLPPMEEAPEEPEEPAVSEPEAAKAVEPSKSHSGRSLTPKEIPPFAWKLVGMSSGRLLTLVKSVEKEEVESHLQRLHREGFYTNLDILPIDPEIAAAKKAADHRPGAKIEPKTSEPKAAGSKAAEPKTPESKAGKTVVMEKSEHKPPPKEVKGPAVARAATDGESEQKPATRPKKTDSKKAEKAPEERRPKGSAKKLEKPEKKSAEVSSNVAEEAKKPKGEMGGKAKPEGKSEAKPAVARKTRGPTDKPRSASVEKRKTEKTKSEKSKTGKTKSVDKSKAKAAPKPKSPQK